MSRYHADTISVGGITVIELHDEATHSVARLIPEVGNNLYDYQIGEHSILLSPPSLDVLKKDNFAPFQFGIPLLFPPNRVKCGHFVFRNQEYQLPINEPPGFHLHGEICSRPWEVLELVSNESEGAYVRNRFQISDHSDILAYFPHPLSFTVTYRLYQGWLYISGTIRNEGANEAPFAFGLHPYFRIPYEKGEEVILHIPAESEWPVTNQALVTGRPVATAFSYELNKGTSISDYPEQGCSLLSLKKGDSVCRLKLADRGYTIGYRIGPEFPFAVLFRPGGEPAFSIEPYTYVTDAFNLSIDYEESGAKGLQGGEEFHFASEIWIE